MITLTCQDNGIGIDLDKHGAKPLGYKHSTTILMQKGTGLFITKKSSQWRYFMLKVK
jgi:hypothetical protein